MIRPYERRIILARLMALLAVQVVIYLVSAHQAQHRRDMCRQAKRENDPV